MIRPEKVTHRSRRERAADGFALPIIIIIGLFLVISGLTLAAQMFESLATSKKNNLQQQSFDIAETGLAKITSQLNEKYRYLLVNCYRENQAVSFDAQSSCNNSDIGGWSQNASPSPSISGAACLGEENGQAREKDN